MRRLILCALLAVGLLATDETLTITVRSESGNEATFIIVLRPKTILNKLTCDLDTMEPGDTATCTVGLNQAASRAFPVQVIAMPGFTTPPTVTIPKGAASMTFAVTRDPLATPASAHMDPHDIYPWNMALTQMVGWGFVSDDRPSRGHITRQAQ